MRLELCPHVALITVPFTAVNVKSGEVTVIAVPALADDPRKF
jgi:hypothetical protein